LPCSTKLCNRSNHAAIRPTVNDNNMQINTSACIYFPVCGCLTQSCCFEDSVMWCLDDSQVMSTKFTETLSFFVQPAF
jgi:hypothetical protein